MILFIVLEKHLPLHWYGIGLGPLLVLLFYGGNLTAARALFGVQAQIHTAGGLALWNRCRDLDHFGYERQLYDELLALGVIADFREPCIIRMAPVPLYNSFEDVHTFGRVMRELLA